MDNQKQLKKLEQQKEKAGKSATQQDYRIFDS